jgi:hypothetical protein
MKLNTEYIFQSKCFQVFWHPAERLRVLVFWLARGWLTSGQVVLMPVLLLLPRCPQWCSKHLKVVEMSSLASTVRLVPSALEHRQALTKNNLAVKTRQMVTADCADTRFISRVWTDGCSC